MQKLNNRNILYVEDGEDFIVVVKLKPSVSDPALEFPGISQGFPRYKYFKNEEEAKNWTLPE